MIPVTPHKSSGVSRTALLFCLLFGILLFDQFRNVFSRRNRIVKMKAACDAKGLIRLLKHRDPEVQYEAAEALGDIGDAGAVHPLIAALENEETSGVRWKAAEALAKIGSPAVAPLIEVLQHPDEDVRWKAAIALGMTGDPRAVDPLIHCLSDKDRFVKGRAALALGMIGQPAVAPLIRILREGDGNMRQGAVIALGRIRDPGAVEPLVQQLKKADNGERRILTEALDAILASCVEPPKKNLLKRKDGEPENHKPGGMRTVNDNDRGSQDDR